MAMLASNAQFVQWILKVKSNIDSGQFKPMQHAAVEALKAPKEWYDNMNRTYRSRRDLAGQIMHAIGCTYDENQVGMFLWGKIPAEAEGAKPWQTRYCMKPTFSLPPDLSSEAVANVTSVSHFAARTKHYRKHL